MSKRNGKNKLKISYLDEINYIDKRLKRAKTDEDKSRLVSRRNTLRLKLKTKK
tara:strand:- start:736 stop:894 length:159 start_codon:yes stop_codon:yes gene_type:complete